LASSSLAQNENVRAPDCSNQSITLKMWLQGSLRVLWYLLHRQVQVKVLSLWAKMEYAFPLVALVTEK
jgi:hypothetical protein